MSKMFAFIGSMVVGYAGWFLGEPFGMFTAFVLSIVGTGVGIYVGRRIGRHYEG